MVKLILHIRRISFCTCLLLVISTLKAQQEYITDSLSRLSIKNEKLLPILDRFLEHEKGCEYYDPELLFEIHFQVINDTTTIQIESIGYEKMRLGNELGYFVYQDHFFFVTGKYLKRSLFSLTDKKKQFGFYLYEDDCNSEENVPLIEIVDDSSYSFYVYNYVKNNFVFKELHTYCH